MFWDASALVPTLVPEARSSRLVSLVRAHSDLTLWWGSPVECQSALYRYHREARMPADILTEALDKLRGLVADADVIVPTSGLRDWAGRLLAAHPLRAGDALQLAAALAWCAGSPDGASFVCLDDRLRAAARREGFAVLPD